MDYFSKVKSASLKAAQQGYNLIHTVTAAAQDMAANPTFQSKKPVDDFLLRFQTVCQTLDNLAKMDNAGTAEAERILNDSKVRDHVKEMLRHLQVEDEQWVGAHVKGGEDEIREHPCLEVFLQNHVMEELCSRAKRDKPRGCLPFVLAIATSVLRVVRYPLLPHQTVHTSLCQLIVNASSISSRYTAIAKGKGQSTSEIVSYVKKIDMNLVALISALWKRITESPDLLAFFRFIDTRDNAKVRQHLYAITCLIPLMGKPRVGLAAKEALLLAVSMHDSRVDSFIIQETNLAKNIVSELCKKFESCIASTASLATAGPVTSGTRLRECGDALFQSPSPGSTPKPVAVDSFIRVLRFCAAFVAAASDEITLDGESLQSSICGLFAQQFLNECVKARLLENGEQQVLAAQSLCAYLLQEVSSPGRGKPNESCTSITQSPSNSASSSMHTLRPLTTHLFCNDSEILQAFLPRVGSVSRAVSVSTMQLLSTLLEACSLEEAKRLVFAFSPSDGKGDAAVLKEGEVNHLIQQSLARGDSIRRSSGWMGTLSLGDAKINYKDASLSRILQTMTSNDLSHSLSSAVEASDQRFASGSLFDLTARKLRVFLTLKYDEQVAVTGLVERCITVLAVLTSQGNDEFLAHECVAKISELNDCSCELIQQLSSHLEKVPECSSKLLTVRTMLMDPKGVDSRAKKVIDNENQQVVRILETGVLIHEMFCEIEGGLLAMNQLHGMLHIVDPDDECEAQDNECDEGSCSSDDENLGSDEGDDDDGDFNIENVGELGELGNLVSEESFLSACAGLEESLDVILRSNEDISLAQLEEHEPKALASDSY